VLGAGLMYAAFSSLVWALGASTGASMAAGAAAGILTGGIVAMPFVQRLRRLLEHD
jgi:hypothetical protein